ncbi:MBL fold metallo-hydrolase [Gracilibacillus salinarum]|uniref:MBL fold metallo-hydrolase n=1 Tax=Gracilibacillus salinarum TaxID=2932255 RepID=A0ABY4GK83_9BACI|nr:MBL fold metallo-hydrolase [Gracilibacillus salinarum]UOQ84182.1 MBL fold metallo-hydrolase [Gracilibacillus salinarum]
MDQEHKEKWEELERDFDHAVPEEISPDIAYYRTLLANVIMIGAPNDSEWILVDAGIKKYQDRILHACEQRYGNKPPAAIILTHGHFDHIGSVKKLVDHWQVPVYIHQNEMDFVTGITPYPPGDPTVGGGMISLLSTIFPTKPDHLEGIVSPLPNDGSIPYLSEWKYIETFGHTPGHISLFREKDRVLIAGDAISTEKAESSFSVFFPIQHVYGPPAYFTQDWAQAELSVHTINELEPDIVIAGHGLPMQGETMKQELSYLAEHFQAQAIPKHKRN